MVKSRPYGITTPSHMPLTYEGCFIFCLLKSIGKVTVPSGILSYRRPCDCACNDPSRMMLLPVNKGTLSQMHFQIASHPSPKRRCSEFPRKDGSCSQTRAKSSTKIKTTFGRLTDITPLVATGLRIIEVIKLLEGNGTYLSFFTLVQTVKGEPLLPNQLGFC